ncbi:uncharacterized protein LOC143248858 isoform X2 [Tachypleus tridentatus]
MSGAFALPYLVKHSTDMGGYVPVASILERQPCGNGQSKEMSLDSVCESLKDYFSPHDLSCLKNHLKKFDVVSKSQIDCNEGKSFIMMRNLFEEKCILKMNCTQFWAPFLNKNIELFEKVQRRAVRIICWLGVMELAGYKRSLMKTIRKRQMEFLGHICRKKGIEKQMLCGKIEGRKCRGCQRTKYIDSLNNYVTKNSMSNIKLIRRIHNREVWHAMVVNVCRRFDT